MKDFEFEEFLQSIDQARERKKSEELDKKLNDVMLIPKDIELCSFKEKAEILTLHFIGYLVKPIGISEDLYNLCLWAFNEHRGKFEKEEESVYNVIKTYYGRQRKL